jgi:hypothetical protein
MTNDTTNGGVRFAEDVIDEAVDTIDRLRDLKVRERTVEIPDAMTRWRRSAEKDAIEIERAAVEQQQRNAGIAGIAELEAAEVEAEFDQSWNAWLDARLANERSLVLEVMGEVVGKAVADLHEEYDGKVATLTHEIEQERTARQRDRERALQRLKDMRAAHAEMVETLRAELRAQQRALDLLQIRSRESEVEHERRVEREEAAAFMMRALFEEMMLRR